MLRLATREEAAGLIAEAEAAAEVKDADEGKEFGRGKRLRYVTTNACYTMQQELSCANWCCILIDAASCKSFKDASFSWWNILRALQSAGSMEWVHSQH